MSLSNIHEVSGDILLTSAQAIAHGVAPNDPFHSGLALSLREKWPAMYKDFRHYCQTDHPKPGSIWSWSGATSSGPIRLVALLTQSGGYEHGSKPGLAQTSFIHHALEELRTWIEQEQVSSVAVPRLATGVGGMEWTDVYPLIRQHLGNLQAGVFVYTTYQRGIKASESR